MEEEALYHILRPGAETQSLSLLRVACLSRPLPPVLVAAYGGTHAGLSHEDH